MRTYARIQDGRVVELLASDQNIGNMFHPALKWVDVTKNTSIAEGWLYDGAAFSKPTPLYTEAVQPSVAALQAQLAALAAQLSALSNLP